jgi:parallel beta-helix repeat protein
MTVLSVSGTVIVERAPMSTSFGDTLYVGGSGPGNYTSIQKAIDDTEDGDTVFVYDDSSPYYENLIVDKSISLIGEDRLTTVIDGNEKKEDGADVISIKIDGVTIQGFTIQNSSIENLNQNWNDFCCGIEIRSHYNIIKDNIITDNYQGIQLGGLSQIYSTNNIIQGNIVSNNEASGLFFTWASYNIISNNTITSNKKRGLNLCLSSDNNTITSNTITENDEGILISEGNKNTIQQNTISDNKLGIAVKYSYKTNVIENNIYDNEKNAEIETATLGLIRHIRSNTWNGNYWGQPLTTPQLIIGKCYFVFLNVDFIYSILKHPLYFPLIKVDWNPAQEPYDIGV